MGGHGIGMAELGHVTHHPCRIAGVEQPAEPGAEARDVGAGDRGRDDQGERHLGPFP